MSVTRTSVSNHCVTKRRKGHEEKKRSQFRRRWFRVLKGNRISCRVTQVKRARLTKTADISGRVTKRSAQDLTNSHNEGQELVYEITTVRRLGHINNHVYLPLFTTPFETYLAYLKTRKVERLLVLNINSGLRGDIQSGAFKH